MTLILRGATLIDGRGRDPVRDATVTVEGDRISDVNGGSRARTGAIDLSGLTLLPGLIDAHAHVGLVDVSDDGTKHPIAVTAARIFRVCGLALDAGYTTIRDTAGADGGLARAQAMGLIRGPRILPSGPLICQTGGHGELRAPFDDHHAAKGLPGLVRLATTCDGPDEVRRAVREAFRKGATQIKVCVSGGVVSLSDDLEDPQLTVEELAAAVAEARTRRTYVTAHAHNRQGIRNGLAAGVRCFEHVSFLDEAVAAEVAAAGAYVVPTLSVAHLMATDWREWGIPEESVGRVAGVEDAMAQATRMAMEAGVKVGSGTDLLGPEQNRRGLEIVLKSKIVGPMAAIVSATQTNAEILGLADEIGTVVEGKRADLVAVDGDPLETPELFDDPARIVLVVQGGRIVKDLRRARGS